MPAFSESTPGTTGQPLGPAGPQQQGAPPPAGLGLFLPLMIGLFLFMILTSILGSRKEKKRRQELLGSLARYDRVVTTGGMIGTIVEVKNDEVVIKVDESTNTKIHFNRAAVQSVLKKGPGKPGSADSDKAQAESLEPAEQIA